ncbi:hypothetical protein FJT64_022781 [Amphibalanus amphitrite]|uniref:Uncharacterized protein n=1 Tax=Amphibalanus amphitrite TaxID=1232801 RepID=A0A6A4WTM3_AMPAM|nr:hypothetical protein FJT64_022781 [Amphibalanus amphitrite]
MAPGTAHCLLLLGLTVTASGTVGYQLLPAGTVQYRHPAGLPAAGGWYRLPPPADTRRHWDDAAPWRTATGYTATVSLDRAPAFSPLSLDRAPPFSPLSPLSRAPALSPLSLNRAPALSPLSLSRPPALSPFSPLSLGPRPAARAGPGRSAAPLPADVRVSSGAIYVHPAGPAQTRGRFRGGQPSAAGPAGDRFSGTMAQLT